MGRLSAAVLELDARVTALEETAAADPLAGIAIADENRCIPYEADEYSYPQSVEAEIVAAMGGRIYSPYTGETFASMAEVDIDHIVARSEAHESGLCAADGATRRAFASDMLNLTLADPVLNRDQKDSEGCGRVDAGTEPLLVRGAGGRSEAQVRVDDGSAGGDSGTLDAGVLHRFRYGVPRGGNAGAGSGRRVGSL